jgi:hypothetical protein
MAILRLRFPSRLLRHWARRNSDPDEPPLAPAATARIRRDRRLRKRDLVALARWKTPRSRRLVASNTSAAVRRLTRTALTTADERLRIETLTRLSGVGWPTASVILHFCHRDPYPILDVRALWSLGIERAGSSHRFELWSRYTAACRRLAAGAGCSMRTLDRALWQYSRERQARAPDGTKKKAKKAKPRPAVTKRKKASRRRRTIMRHSREG